MGNSGTPVGDALEQWVEHLAGSLLGRRQHTLSKVRRYAAPPVRLESLKVERPQSGFEFYVKAAFDRRSRKRRRIAPFRDFQTSRLPPQLPAKAKGIVEKAAGAGTAVRFTELDNLGETSQET